MLGGSYPEPRRATARVGPPPPEVRGERVVSIREHDGFPRSAMFVLVNATKGACSLRRALTWMGVVPAVSARVHIELTRAESLYNKTVLKQKTSTNHESQAYPSWSVKEIVVVGA